jgi:hypothetical protein
MKRAKEPQKGTKVQKKSPALKDNFVLFVLFVAETFC